MAYSAEDQLKEVIRSLEKFKDSFASQTKDFEARLSRLENK